MTDDSSALRKAVINRQHKQALQQICGHATPDPDALDNIRQKAANLAPIPAHNMPGAAMQRQERKQEADIYSQGTAGQRLQRLSEVEEAAGREYVGVLKETIRDLPDAARLRKEKENRRLEHMDQAAKENNSSAAQGGPIEAEGLGSAGLSSASSPAQEADVLKDFTNLKDEDEKRG